MGTIASPLSDRSPVSAIQELWGGELPTFDTMEELNHLLHVLINGLWNSLTVHLIESNPFKLARVQVKQTREGLHQYALVRKQEIDGFVNGLFGRQEGLDSPEGARDGVDVLGEIRVMLDGAITLLDDPGLPAAPDDLKGLSENLRGLATIIEKELNTMLLSCTRARRQIFADVQQTKLVVH
jgi:hypothetical protein